MATIVLRLRLLLTSSNADAEALVQSNRASWECTDAVSCISCGPDQGNPSWDNWRPESRP